jgi:multidrug transporter EmrE-like cation transporter
MIDRDLIVAFFNAALCAGVVFVCICRLAVSSKRVKVSVRNHYVVWGGAALMSALSPVMFHEPVSIGQVLMSGAVFLNLLIGSVRWKYGAPLEVMADRLRTPPPVGQ